MTKKEGNSLSNDAAALLWRFLIVVVFAGTLLTAIVVVIGAHQHEPVSSDPLLTNATGYGKFLGTSGDALIFTFSCVRPDDPTRHSVNGPFQVLSSRLSFDVAVRDGSAHSSRVESVSLSTFLLDQRSAAFDTYVEVSATRQVVTDAPGTTGCAGTISPSGGLT